MNEWKKKRRAVKNVSVNSNNKRNYFGGNQVIMALLATLLTILFWLILEMENHGKNKNKTSARSHRKLKFERKLHREKVWEQNEEDVEEFITWIWFQLRETIMNFWTDRKNLSGKNKFIFGGKMRQSWRIESS